MDKSLYLEKNISQQPAIDLLRSMGYTYISPEDCEAQRGSRYHVLLKDILRGQLRRLNRYAFAGAENEFSAANIERAMEDLDEPLTDGLIRSSEKIYDALLLGKSYPETVGEGKTLSFNLKYIDWEHPENNLFHVTEEFAVDSRDKIHNARPISCCLSTVFPSLSLSVKLHKSVWNRLWSRTFATSKRSISHSSTSLLRS